MEDILVFQHDPLEDLGLFAQLLERERSSFRYIRLFREEIPTEDWEEIRALIILGGPMSVHGEEQYPFLRWEKTILRNALKQGVPILGICLGAQLIAEVAGAQVYRGNFKEIGWYPISMTIEGQMDSLVGYLPEKPTVFQWNGEGFDLPRGAVRLASSIFYDNQAFRIGKNVYGLQFHLETTPAMVERWLEEHSRAIAQIPYISPDKIRADNRSYSQTLRYYGERFFSQFIHRLASGRTRKEERHQAKT